MKLAEPMIRTNDPQGNIKAGVVQQRISVIL